MEHNFILKPGNWLGKGDAHYKDSDSLLQAEVRWTVLPKKDDEIAAEVNIHLAEGDESYRFVYRFHDINDTHFKIDFSCDDFGMLQGEGSVIDDTIAWKLSEGERLAVRAKHVLQADGSYHCDILFRLLNSEQISATVILKPTS